MKILFGKGGRKPIFKLFYKPSLTTILVDIITLVLSAGAILDLAPLSTSTPFSKYAETTIIYFLIWGIVSYGFKRYIPFIELKYFRAVVRLVITAITVIFIMQFLMLLPFFNNFSIWVYIAYELMNLLMAVVVYILYFSVKYAVEYTEPDISPIAPEREEDLAIEVRKAPEKEVAELETGIIAERGARVLDFIRKYINLQFTGISVNPKVNHQFFLNDYTTRFTNITMFELLNEFRGINKLFFSINQRLPQEGIFICSFEQSSARKQRILKQFPPVINRFILSVDYIVKRLIPKLFLLRGIYDNVSEFNDRVLSKTEVMGRLYHMGFEVIDTKKINGITYIVARKLRTMSALPENKNYGPLIKLKRMGKKGKLFNVYKIRTMYPYSEFLQSYIYEHNQLQKGGKFNKDIRINSMGKFLRKYWIDELPMLFNLAKGNMKLVGVRPLSQQYFNLYTTELQKKRIQHKPGLLPPFYADMPETLDDIIASELKYLNACEQNGTFRTDMRYFFIILKNIFLNKARSA